jgi:hypothetical protein
LIQLIFKAILVLVQKVVSKNNGWPEPSKFAFFYENMLANCPYRQFFDTTSLCDPANAESVRQLSQMDEEEAASFFEATFCGPTMLRRTASMNVIKSLW